jgi:hypothetical protein
MLQNNDKSKYILIWLNFIDLEDQSSINFDIKKNRQKIFHYQAHFEKHFNTILTYNFKIMFYSAIKTYKEFTDRLNLRYI